MSPMRHLTLSSMQVLAAVFGPKEVSQRSQLDSTGAIVRCEYAMAAFSTGAARNWGWCEASWTLEMLLPLQEGLQPLQSVYCQLNGDQHGASLRMHTLQRVQS
jgi:hypothetical protein